MEYEVPVPDGFCSRPDCKRRLNARVTFDHEGDEHPSVMFYCINPRCCMVVDRPPGTDRATAKEAAIKAAHQLREKELATSKE